MPRDTAATADNTSVQNESKSQPTCKLLSVQISSKYVLIPLTASPGRTEVKEGNLGNASASSTIDTNNRNAPDSLKW